MHRRLAIVAGVIFGIIGLALVLLLAVTNTNWGRERVRRIAESALQDAAKRGVVRLGRVSGNLLTGFSIADLSIRDSSGAPFLVADTVSTNYGLRALIGKRLALSDVRLVRPLIVLDRPPEGEWNYKYLFSSGKKKQSSDTTPGFGDWISFRDVTLVGGRFIVRSPWKPSSELTTEAARDSATAEALRGGTRVAVVRAPGGYQKVMEFRDIDATFPYLRLRDPDTRVRRLEVASLNMIGEPFRPPVVDVRSLVGAFEFTGDSIWFQDIRAQLTGSTLAGSGSYGFEDEHFDLNMRGSPVVSSDMRWIYPRAPAGASGTLDFGLRWRGDTATYSARNVEARIDSARIAGRFAVTLTDTSTRFHDTDLRFAALDTRLIEQLVPSLDVPRRGILSGSATLDGAMDALDVDADVTFDDANGGTSRALAVGRIGVGKGFSARDLRVTLRPVQVELARIAAPDLPIGGTITGTATVDGSTETALMARADLTHLDRGLRSHIVGRGEVRLGGGRQWIDVDAQLRPLSLAEVGRFAPALGLRGNASGPIRVTGELRDLALRGALATPDGGRLGIRGQLDLASRVIGYDIAVRADLFNANQVVAKAPRTSITATAFGRGRGFSPETMRAAFGLDMLASSIDTVALDSAKVRIAIADGVATVDSLRLSGPATSAEIEGTFGLVSGRSGELRYRLAVDTLNAFRRFLPAGDTGAVAPRPGLLARRLAQARRDSAVVAQASEVARAAIGGPPPPRVPVDTPQAVPRDSLAGSVRLAGTVRGALPLFDVRGRLGAEGIVAQGSSVRRAQGEYAWMGAPAKSSTMVLAADLDSVSAAGFALDSVNARVSYHAPGGKVALAIHQHERDRDSRDERAIYSGQDYTVGADFTLHTDHKEVHLNDLALRFDTTRWESTRPSTVRWGGKGIEIKTLELRGGERGRVYVDGRLPTEGPASLDVAVDHFEIGDLVALLQSDIEARGLVTLNAKLSGTSNDPRIRGAFGMVRGSYNGGELPNLRATVDYANASLVTRLEGVRGGAPLFVATGTVPVDLAMNAKGPRLPDRPMSVDLDADSLPLEIIPQFTDLISGSRGIAFGSVRVRGTVKRPAIAGALALQQGTFRLEPTGVRMNQVAASIRMAGDSLVIDSIAAFAGGHMLLRGGIGLRDFAKPSFDLYFVADNARFLDNDQGSIRADAGIAIKGPFDRVYVSGRAGIREGVFYLPEPEGKKVISTRDPALFSVIDTSVVSDREVVAGQSPLLANLRMDVNVNVSRDTWVRSKDANVEIFTPPDRDLQISVDQRRSAIALEGELSTDRGEYTFLGKRFQIRRGSATFIGLPELNPTLQVAGEYEVQVPSREALVIRVVIGGTMRNPRLSLESDAQPPITQSDLLSYLAFGRSSSSLLQFQGSALSGGGGGGSGNIAGAGAALVGQRLAAVALDVFVDEFEGEAARSLGADVFEITPADIYTEVAQNGQIAGFLKGTQLEAGKYTDPNTFVSVRARPTIFSSASSDRTVPGLRLVRRTGKGYRFEASYEPRYILRQPTLEQNSENPNINARAVFGLVLLREWRF